MNKLKDAWFVGFYKNEVAAILIIAGMLFASGIEAEEEWITDHHVIVTYYFGSKPQALAACEEFARNLNYPVSYCGFHFQTSRYTAGWFKSCGSHLCYPVTPEEPFYWGEFVVRQCSEVDKVADRSTGACQYPENHLGCDNESEGNPVNMRTGNKWQRERDLKVGMLSFERFYNSFLDLAGDMGVGWRHSYQARIESVGNPSLWVKLRRADGSARLFERINQEWVARGYPDISLTQLYDEQGRVRGWKYRQADGYEQLFDAEGRLVQLIDRKGTSTLLSYDTEGRLYEVKSNLSGQLIFTYDSLGRVTSVSDSSGRTLEYGYDDLGNLTHVAFPDGSTKQYLYEDSNHNHALTGIVDENGVRYATWRYDDEGRAVLSEHAQGAERVEITYGADGVTTVLDAQGSHRTYQFDNFHGVLKPIEISYH